MSTPPPKIALDHDPFLRELLARTAKAEGRSAARFILVNDTNLLTRFGQSVLWMKGEGVVALSGAIDPDLNAPYVQLADRLAKALHQPDLTAPRVLAEGDPALASAEGWQEHLPPHLAWIPMNDRVTRKAVGGLLLARDKAWTEGELAKLAEWCLAWHWAYQAYDRRTFVETANEFLRGLPAQVGREDEGVGIAQLLLHALELLEGLHGNSHVLVLFVGLRDRSGVTGARSRTRTGTPVKASGPKPGASTNFATRAVS